MQIKDTNIKNNKDKSKNILFWTLVTLGIIFSLALVFNKQIEHLIVQHNQTTALNGLSRDQIDKNNKKKGEYSFDSVKSLNASKAARDSFGDALTIGAISEPKVKLRLPIEKGLSDVNMATGASTMRSDQKMGKGNYPLAGHYMTNSGALFSPIAWSKPGYMVYITDMKRIYKYKIYENKIVSPHATYIVNNTKKKQITMITCADWGANRYCVRGNYRGSMKATNNRLHKYFNL